MIRIAVLAVCLALVPQVFAQSVSDFAEAHSKADAHTKSEAALAYAEAWAEFINRNLLVERDGCYF